MRAAKGKNRRYYLSANTATPQGVICGNFPRGALIKEKKNLPPPSANCWKKPDTAQRAGGASYAFGQVRVLSPKLCPFISRKISARAKRNRKPMRPSRSVSSLFQKRWEW